MADSTLAKILAAFLLLIVGISLVVVAADSTNDVTEKTTKTESVSIASARNATGGLDNTVQISLDTGVNNWRNDYEECIPTTIVFKNQTGQEVTDPTDYAYVYNTGKITVNNVENLNRTAAGNTTSAEYTYCQDGYVTVAWGRTALDTGIGLFGVALMLGAIGFMISVFKDFGLA